MILGLTGPEEEEYTSPKLRTCRQSQPSSAAKIWTTEVRFIGVTFDVKWGKDDRVVHPARTLGNLFRD